MKAAVSAEFFAQWGWHQSPRFLQLPCFWSVWEILKFRGEARSSSSSPAVNCLAPLSRIALLIKWKSQPRRTGREGGGREEPSEEPSSSAFFSDDYARDSASCSLQLCFQLCWHRAGGCVCQVPQRPFSGACRLVSTSSGAVAALKL